MSSNIKKQLIRLGYQNPEIRKHLKPVLSFLKGASVDDVSTRVFVYEERSPADFGIAVTVEASASFADSIDYQSFKGTIGTMENEIDFALDPVEREVHSHAGDRGWEVGDPVSDGKQVSVQGDSIVMKDRHVIRVVDTRGTMNEESMETFQSHLNKRIV